MATSAETITATPAMIWHTKVLVAATPISGPAAHVTTASARRANVECELLVRARRGDSTIVWDSMACSTSAVSPDWLIARRSVRGSTISSAASLATLQTSPVARRDGVPSCRSHGPRSGKCRNRSPADGRTAPTRDWPTVSRSRSRRQARRALGLRLRVVRRSPWPCSRRSRSSRRRGHTRCSESSSGA